MSCLFLATAILYIGNYRYRNRKTKSIGWQAVSVFSFANRIPSFSTLLSLYRFAIAWCLMMKPETLDFIIEFVLCFICFMHKSRECVFVCVWDGSERHLKFPFSSSKEMCLVRSISFQRSFGSMEWLVCLNKYLHALWWHPSQDEWLFRHKTLLCAMLLMFVYSACIYTHCGEPFQKSGIRRGRSSKG